MLNNPTTTRTTSHVVIVIITQDVVIVMHDLAVNVVHHLVKIPTAVVAVVAAVPKANHTLCKPERVLRPGAEIQQQIYLTLFFRNTSCTRC